MGSAECYAVLCCVFEKSALKTNLQDVAVERYAGDFLDKMMYEESVLRTVGEKRRVLDISKGRKRYWLEHYRYVTNTR